MRLMNVFRLLIFVVSKLKNTVSLRSEVPLSLKSNRQNTLGRINPFTPTIALVILLTVCHTTFIEVSSESFELNQLMIS